MITTTMTADEILREYKTDYEKYLRPRLLSLATKKTHDLKVARGRWISIKDEIKVKTTTGNIYNLRCQMRWDKRRGAGWSTVSYIVTSDIKTGKRAVYILSDSFPIKLSAPFLREIEISVPEFLKYGPSWDILTVSEENKRYSSYIDFGGDLGAGVGGWEDGVFVLRHLVKKWETDPISEFLKTQEKEEEEDSKVKKSEIDLAWEAYLSGDLDLTV